MGEPEASYRLQHPFGGWPVLLVLCGGDGGDSGNDDGEDHQVSDTMDSAAALRDGEVVAKGVGGKLSAVEKDRPDYESYQEIPQSLKYLLT